MNWIASNCICWRPFRNEKCMKISADRQLQAYENSKSICLGHENGHPSIIIVSSKEEQQSLESLLFDADKITNHVWLGAILNHESFVGKIKVNWFLLSKFWTIKKQQSISMFGNDSS